MNHWLVWCFDAQVPEEGRGNIPRDPHPVPEVRLEFGPKSVYICYVYPAGVVFT